MDFRLLSAMVAIAGLSGDEGDIKTFILAYVEKNKHSWKVKPQIWSDIQDNIVLIFGDAPKCAFYAHLDTIGYTVAYNQKLVKIGGSMLASDVPLKGKDGQLAIKCITQLFKKKSPEYDMRAIFDQKISPGTLLSYDAPFQEDENWITTPYLDDRLGCFLLLNMAEHLTSGVLVFSCLEEIGAGTAAYLARILFEKHHIRKAIIADVTWTTEHIFSQIGPVLSLRDASIPRQTFLKEIKALIQESRIPFQQEVEFSGGSDGAHIQQAFLPIDWCFLGVPIEKIHTPKEKAYIPTIEKTLDLYLYLAERLK
jgi:putative aminopeptidase FrvX